MYSNMNRQEGAIGYHSKSKYRHFTVRGVHEAFSHEAVRAASDGTESFDTNPKHEQLA